MESPQLNYIRMCVLAGCTRRQAVRAGAAECRCAANVVAKSATLYQALQKIWTHSSLEASLRVHPASTLLKW